MIKKIRLFSIVLSAVVFVTPTSARVQPADTIYTNAKVYTVNGEQPWAQAFAVKEGKFVKVGSAEEIAELKGDQTKVVDLGGQLVLPGFVDEHIHIDMVAENRMNVTFDPTQSYEKFETTIKRFLADNPESKWVYGGNLDWLKPDGGTIDAFGKPSHKSTLDAIVTDYQDMGQPVRFAEDLPSRAQRIVINCRPIAMKRALRNLVDNAVRYGEEAVIGYGADGDHVSIRVSDIGPGIPEAHLDNVFEPFLRLEESRSEETGGIGLGLAIARSSVHAHGGTLHLANRKLKGLVATITLPVETGA